MLIEQANDAHKRYRNRTARIQFMRCDCGKPGVTYYGDRHCGAWVCAECLADAKAAEVQAVRSYGAAFAARAEV